MRLAVISGYILASTFALCGLLITTQFCFYGGAENAGQFLNGFVMSAWPLAVSSVILLLVQILCQVEQFHTAVHAGALFSRRPTHQAVSPQNKNNTVSRHEPVSFFPVRETSMPSQVSESQDAPEEQAASPSSEEKLQFFKLH